ncbi:JAM2 protein, partial [Polypterus senegalus]
MPARPPAHTLVFFLVVPKQQFNRATKGDTGNYYCEAFNGVGVPQRCNPKHLQIDDLNVPGIVAAVVVLALIISLCGLGVYFAQRSGYFGSKSAFTDHIDNMKTGYTLIILGLHRDVPSTLLTPTTNAQGGQGCHFLVMVTSCLAFEPNRRTLEKLTLLEGFL